MMNFTHDGVTSWLQDDILQSIKPATTNFGFTYFSLMIPPFKPERVLILGYGQGTIADLIDLVWGDGTIKVTGVDLIEPQKEGRWQADTCLVGNAFELVKNLHDSYDYIVVDLWNGLKNPGEMFTEEFTEDLARISCGMVSFNIHLNRMADAEIFRTHFEVPLIKKMNDNRILFTKPTR